MYNKVREVLKEVYGEDATLVAGLLAATSAKNTMGANITLAMRAYRAFKSEGVIAQTGLFKSHRENIKRVLQGGELKGRKVHALFMNLIGDESYVTVDRWLLRYYGVGNGDGEIRGIPDSLYDKVEAMVVKEAMERGITPAQRQAEIWCDMSGNRTIYVDYICQYMLC